MPKEWLEKIYISPSFRQRALKKANITDRVPSTRYISTQLYHLEYLLLRFVSVKWCKVKMKQDLRWKNVIKSTRSFMIVLEASRTSWMHFLFRQNLFACFFTELLYIDNIYHRRVLTQDHAHWAMRQVMSLNVERQSTLLCFMIKAWKCF